MKFRLPILPCLALLLVATAFTQPQNTFIRDFGLPNANGNWVSTQNYPSAKGFIVIFTCNHCPFAKLYTKRMNDLNTQFSKNDVPLIAINSMDTLVYEDETFALMKIKAKQDSFNFPYLQDASQSVGKQFNAAHTPMAFVIWKETHGWKIRYSGAIDDNGEHPETATAYVSNAINELLQQKKVSLPETQSFGCRIFYRKQ
ncbi:MAG: thioredoxin family protein [Bacteroidetes bacterium]|nr:thioredoxin family protein [Bacteroidota bacterium]